MEHLLNNSASNKRKRRDSGDQTPSPKAESAAIRSPLAMAQIAGRVPPPLLSSVYSSNAYAHPPQHQPQYSQQQYEHQQHARGYYSPTLPPVSHLSHHQHNNVVSSPTAATSGLSTPRLPPISMLTAAASLQPRMRATRHHGDNSASSLASTQMHPDDQDNLCRYRNKRCANARAIKRNGDRHNLCEKHRAKANQNQRKLESKRRTQKKITSTSTAATIVRTQPSGIHQQQHQHQQYHHMPQDLQQQPPSYTAMYRVPPVRPQSLWKKQRMAACSASPDLQTHHGTMPRAPDTFHAMALHLALAALREPDSGALARSLGRGRDPDRQGLEDHAAAAPRARAPVDPLRDTVLDRVLRDPQERARQARDGVPDLGSRLDLRRVHGLVAMVRQLNSLDHVRTPVYTKCMLFRRFRGILGLYMFLSCVLGILGLMNYATNSTWQYGTVVADEALNYCLYVALGYTFRRQRFRSLLDTSVAIVAADGASAPSETNRVTQEPQHHAASSSIAPAPPQDPSGAGVGDTPPAPPPTKRKPTLVVVMNPDQVQALGTTYHVVQTTEAIPPSSASAKKPCTNGWMDAHNLNTLGLKGTSNLLHTEN
ncbi:hypothetical protein FI667_g12215, partial [Globisporangium splendens]